MRPRSLERLKAAVSLGSLPEVVASQGVKEQCYPRAEIPAHQTEKVLPERRATLTFQLRTTLIMISGKEATGHEAETKIPEEDE